jgi:hypothetical protein
MVILHYFVWTLGIALNLSIIRVSQALFYGPRGLSWSDIFYVHYMGFRFDLMIVGFWLSPVVIYLILTHLFSNRGQIRPQWTQWYLNLSWLFICLIYFKDYISYPFTQDRYWKIDHFNHPLLNFQHGQQLAWWSWVFILLICLGIYKGAHFRFPIFVNRLQKASLLSVAFIFIWTAFICRGTLTQHHLRRKDCQFSKSKYVEALCLNPIFTFAKNR